MSRKLVNSNVCWIGQIPESWICSRLKFYCNDIFSGGTPKTEIPEYWDGDIPWLPSGVCHDDYVNDTDKYITQLGYDNSSTRMIPANTALLGMIGGNTGFLTFDACANQSVMAFIEKKEKCNSKYLWYLLKASKNYRLSFTAGAVMQGVNREDCKNYIFPFPEVSEQEIIVSFLDKKLAKIDKLIATSKDIIQRIEEYRKGIISKTVVHGLNSNIKYKKIDETWIKSIPENWNINKFKYASPLRGIKADDKSNYIGLENIESFTGKRIGSTSIPDGDANLFENGDVLFGKLRPYLSKSLFVKEKGCCSGEILVMVPKLIQQKYLYYITLSNDFVKQVNDSTYGAKMPRASWDYIGNLLIPIPPTDEQNKICKFLDEKCIEIDELIKRQNEIVDRLNEYKETLIYNAVTGKMEVK